MASSGGVFSSPDEVRKWYNAVQLYDNGELNAAIDKFKEVMPCAKMLFNIACCHLSINQMDLAVKVRNVLFFTIQDVIFIGKVR